MNVIRPIRNEEDYETALDIDHSDDEERHIVVGQPRRDRAMVVSYPEWKNGIRSTSVREAIRRGDWGTKSSVEGKKVAAALPLPSLFFYRLRRPSMALGLWRMSVVNSSRWLEHFTECPNADSVAPAIEAKRDLVVPVISM